LNLRLFLEMLNVFNTTNGLDRDVTLILELLPLLDLSSFFVDKSFVIRLLDIGKQTLYGLISPTS
jgi:hypothetical protein